MVRSLCIERPIMFSTLKKRAPWPTYFYLVVLTFMIYGFVHPFADYKHLVVLLIVLQILVVFQWVIRSWFLGILLGLGLLAYTLSVISNYFVPHVFDPWSSFNDPFLAVLMFGFLLMSSLVMSVWMMIQSVGLFQGANEKNRPLSELEDQLELGKPLNMLEVKEGNLMDTPRSFRK